MHNYLIITLLVFALPVKKEPIIAWSEDYKLSWSDFKGKPKYSVNAAAITASGITFGFSIRESNKRIISFSTEVQAHFYPEKSWYKPELSNLHILGHEQLHFDITELYARKFRKRISLLKTSKDVANKLRSLHKTINKELSQMQDRYDNETDFSRNFDAQDQWQIFVNNELKKLQHFKSK